MATTKLLRTVIVLTALVNSILFTQCKKDTNQPLPPRPPSPPPPSVKSKIELVTTGKWIMSAFTIVPGIDWNDDGIIETDIYSVMDSCMKDDFTIFKSNGIATGDEGPTKCDSSDTQTYDQPWSFTSNETKMNFDGDIYNIDVLTEQQLKISIENHVDTLVYTTTATYIH
jgi:hypothetical protein